MPLVVAGGLVVGVLAVSSSAILVRLADAPALSIAFWRCLGGAAALAPFALRQRTGAPALDRTQVRQILGAGLLLALHFSLWIGSLSLTTVASSVTLVTMSPLFVGVGATLLLDEPPGRRVWIGMALSVAGAAVVGAGDALAVDLGGGALLGDAMALGGAVAVAGYLLVGRTARQRLPTMRYAAPVYGVAAVAVLVVVLVTRAPLVGYDTTTWLALVGLVVGPQLLGHTVFNALLSRVTATVVSVVVVAEPVGATLLAWILLDELPAALFWAGAPFLLAGVAVATVRGRELAEAHRPPGRRR